MIFDPITLGAALLPAGIDLIKTIATRIVNRFTGGAEPNSVDELIKLKDSDLRQMEAVSKLEAVDGKASTWVVNIIRLQRPLAVFAFIAAYLISLILTVDPEILYVTANLASSATFYLFGDRSLLYLKGQSKNK